MRFVITVILVDVCFLVKSSLLVAGPFGSVPIHWEDEGITVWASEFIELKPTSTGSGQASGANSLGPPDGAFTSLGDLSSDELDRGLSPGSIVVSFSSAVSNGPGWDLVVFENAGEFFEIPFVFGELATIEVSSNGIDFVGFPSESLNVEVGEGPVDDELLTNFGRNFAGINASNVRNLAGIHPQGLGTAFDFNDLASTDMVLLGRVDLNEIQFVRVTDIPGNGWFLDSFERPILDAWPTGGDVGGFDLDAIAGRYPVACDLCPATGDVDSNGKLDVEDIHQLVIAILNQHFHPRFDINHDGLIDHDDLFFWIHHVANTYVGDSNLDGEFNTGDLIEVFQAGEYEDGLNRNSNWAEGDWNADGDFDSSDLVVAFANGGYEQRPAANAVPEPSSAVLLIVGLLVAFATNRRPAGPRRR
ncbi:MAG: EF-hand domain-containing protein [Planctomycetaceae bacterium]|nr:EF-hand domain-containing protein [Planctomycetaceae bacterium]